MEYLHEQRRLARLERRHTLFNGESKTTSPKTSPQASPPLSPIPQFKSSIAMKVVGLLSEDTSESPRGEMISRISTAVSNTNNATPPPTTTIADGDVHNDDNHNEKAIRPASRASKLTSFGLGGPTIAEDSTTAQSKIDQTETETIFRFAASHNSNLATYNEPGFGKSYSGFVPSIAVPEYTSEYAPDCRQLSPGGNSIRFGVDTTLVADQMEEAGQKRLAFLHDDVSVPDSIELATSEHWEVLRNYCSPALPADDSVTHTAEEVHSFWNDAQHNPAVVDAATGFEDVFPCLYLVPPLPAMLINKCVECEKVLDLEVLIYKTLDKAILDCERHRDEVETQLQTNTIPHVEEAPDAIREQVTRNLRGRQEIESLPRIVDTQLVLNANELSASVLAATTGHSTLRRPVSPSNTQLNSNMNMKTAHSSAYLTEFEDSRVGLGFGFPESQSAFLADTVMQGISFDKLVLSADR